MQNTSFLQFQLSIDEMDAKEILASLSLTSVTIAEMSLNVINFFILPYFFIRIRSAKMIHKNLRTMLVSTLQFILYNLFSINIDNILNYFA